MRVAVFTGERDLSELVARLFDVHRAAASVARQAEQALREANPHLDLRNLRRLPEGTPILVPDVPGARPTREAQPLATPLTGLADATARSLKLVRATLDESLRRRVDDLEGSAQLLRSREVRAEAGRDPELSEHIAKLTQALDDQLRQAKEQAATQQQAFELLLKDVEEFEKRAG